MVQGASRHQANGNTVMDYHCQKRMTSSSTKHPCCLHIAVFSPKVEEISLLTINTFSSFRSEVTYETKLSELEANLFGSVSEKDGTVSELNSAKKVIEVLNQQLQSQGKPSSYTTAWPQSYRFTNVNMNVAVQTDNGLAICPCYKGCSQKKFVLNFRRSEAFGPKSQGEQLIARRL